MLLPEPGDPKTAYLVDLSSTARACYACIKAHSPSGEPIGAVAGTVGRLVKLLKERSPAYMAWCADDDELTVRHEEWPLYKSKRPPRPPEYLKQETLLRQILAMHGVPVLHGHKFEADDWIASAAERCVQAGLKVVIVSNDHDLWQLVADNDKIVCWDGKSGQGTGHDEVVAKYGVSPDTMPDLLALMGDGDETPKLPGIGKKTAMSLVQQFGTLDAVLAADVPGKVGKTLKSHAADARLALKMVTLRVNVDGIDVEKMVVGWSDDAAKQISMLYSELGFTRLAAVRSMKSIA